MVSTFYSGDHSSVIPAANLATNPRPAPLTDSERETLIRAVVEWQQAGCLVHPCRIGGGKQPFAVEGGSPDLQPDIFPETFPSGKPHPQAGQPNPNAGKHGWGHGRVRDGDVVLTNDEIAAIIRSGRSDGIGIFCGTPSNGLEMLEIEARARHLLPDVRQAAIEKGCLHLLERLSKGCTSESGSGGLHFPLRVTDGVALPDQVLACRPDPDDPQKVQVLAETSGEGQWFVAAPSGGRTHKSGNSYRLLRGGPATIASFTGAERDLIYSCFRALDEMPQQQGVVVQKPRKRLQRRPGDPLTAAEDFNDRGNWDDILLPKGWKKQGQPTTLENADGTTDSKQVWCRPGKSGGTSATTTSHALCSFTSSTPLPKFVQPRKKGERGENVLSKFATYSYLYHLGDDGKPNWAAASRALSEKGYGSDGLDGSQVVVVEEMPDRGEVRDLDDWRLEMRAERALALRQPGYHLDRSQTGSGKTHATISEIVRAVKTIGAESAATGEDVRSISRVLTVLPDHANIRERVEEYRAAGLDAVAYPEMSPETCGRHDRVKRAQSLGLVAGSAVCWNCPLQNSCLYMKQMAAAKKSQYPVATHERLRLSPETVTDGVDAIVIDEHPEPVVAPAVTARVDDLNPVVMLAQSVRDGRLFRRGRVLETAPEEQAFAEAIIEAQEMLVTAAEQAQQAGVVEIDMPAVRAIPKHWQTTLLRWADEVDIADLSDKRKQDRFQKAMRLITMIVTGGLERLYLVIEQTSRHEKQADGTVLEWSPLHHFVTGSWTTPLPSVPVLMLDATADLDGLRARLQQDVTDRTPAGHLPLIQKVVQVPWDVTKDQSPATTAGLVEAFLMAHPEVQRAGVIGHQAAIKAMMSDDAVLSPVLRARIAKSCWFGQGPDRASNDWHATCDHLIVIGTPRYGSGAVRERLVLTGKLDAAALPAGDWGARHWEAVTVDGRAVTLESKGYRHPEWHAAHVALTRAALHQAIGRGRGVTSSGMPTTVISDEPLGVAVDDRLEPVTPVVREAVEAVRRVVCGEAGTELFPIKNSYRKMFGSRVGAKVGAVIDLMVAEAAQRGDRLGQRGAEKRLALARQHGRLNSPVRGWLVLTDGQAVAATVPPPVPAIMGPTVHATVIRATGPTGPTVAADVVAEIIPETTTTVMTSHVPSMPPGLDATVQEIEERAAIMAEGSGFDDETADRLAQEAVLGRGVTGPLEPAASVGVDHVSLAARLHPLVDQAVQRFGGSVRVVGEADDPFSTGWGRRQTKPLPGRCSCGCDRWQDFPIHDGRSVRRDCAKCEKFQDFVVWYGKADPPVGSSAKPLPAAPSANATPPSRLAFYLPAASPLVASG